MELVCVCVNVFVCVRALCERVYMRMCMYVVSVCVNVFVCVGILCERVYVRLCVCGECVWTCLCEWELSVSMCMWECVCVCESSVWSCVCECVWVCEGMWGSDAAELKGRELGLIFSLLICLSICHVPVVSRCWNCKDRTLQCVSVHACVCAYLLFGLKKPQLKVFKLRLQRLVHLFYEYVLPSWWKGDLFPLLEDTHSLVLCFLQCPFMEFGFMTRKSAKESQSLWRSKCCGMCSMFLSVWDCTTDKQSPSLTAAPSLCLGTPSLLLTRWKISINDNVSRFHVIRFIM